MAALNGIVVAKDQPELAEAIRAAVQHLIDSGALYDILVAWGNENGMIRDLGSGPAAVSTRPPPASGTAWPCAGRHRRSVPGPRQARSPAPGSAP